MKVLTCIQPGSFAYEEKPLPVLQPGHAIIKIKRIGICGTDLHAFEGTQPFFSYPRILGHELSGELVELFLISGAVNVWPAATGCPTAALPLMCAACM
jgi:threonine dehydrogenase-like Zn-dependent dehydrogenase